jgi:hypothetical protein
MKIVNVKNAFKEMKIICVNFQFSVQGNVGGYQFRPSKLQGIEIKIPSPLSPANLHPARMKLVKQ